MALPGSEVLIRKATRDDAEAMHDICLSVRSDAVPNRHPITGELYEGYDEYNQSWLEQNQATGLQRLHAYIDGSEPGLCQSDPLLALAAEVNREVVGYALAKFTVNWATEYRGTMVRREFAGMSIGSALEEVRYAWANIIGETIFVNTASAHGHNFLVRHGFLPTCGFYRRPGAPVSFRRFYKNPEHKRNEWYKYEQIPPPARPELINTH